MVRAPCCEKMGLKKGPWTLEEDNILTSYINRYGHGNWRALPKQAGLLRCGKSCRLRWINYLRPDVKRGSFSKEEEETIIGLHQMLGNKWSAIATRLSGRTDNEIKNVWHTHLKKRLSQNQANPVTKQSHFIEMEIQSVNNYPNQVMLESPQDSSCENSSVTTTTTCMNVDALENFPEVDENFWSDVFSDDNSGGRTSGLPAAVVGAQVQFSPLQGYNSKVHDGMDFWYHLFTAAEELQELPDF